MSTETTATKPQPVTDPAETTENETQASVGFSRKATPESIHIKFRLPLLFPKMTIPFEFFLGWALSGEAQKRRQKYLAQAPAKRVDGAFEQTMDELCDLISLAGKLPKGFDDLTDVPGQKAGDTFRNYVMTATGVGAKESLKIIVNCASDLYWGTTVPQEFRDTV